MRKNCLLWLVVASVPVNLVNAMAWFGVFLFVNPYLIKRMGFTNTDWTAATLWYIGGMIVWQLLCTEISSRLGRRRTVILALAISAFFYAAIGAVANPNLIRLLFVFVSFAPAAIIVAWLPQVAEIGGERPGQALAIVQIVGAAVGSATLIGGGYLLIGEHYRQLFHAFALASALSAVAFAASSRGIGDGARTEVVSLRAVTKADLLRAASGPFLVVALAGFCMEPFNYHTINQLFPNIARQVYGFTSKDVGVVVALARLPAVLSMLALAHLIDRMRPLQSYGAGLLLAGFAVAAISLAEGPGMLVAGLLGFYLFHGVVWASNLAATNAAVDGRLRDSAFAVANVLGLFALFGVGVAHNRMLAAGLTLPEIFRWSGLLGAAGGLLLLGYSFTRGATGEAPRPTLAVSAPASVSETSSASSPEAV